MNRYKPIGWQFESQRHSLAARGIKTSFYRRPRLWKLESQPYAPQVREQLEAERMFINRPERQYRDYMRDYMAVHPQAKEITEALVAERLAGLHGRAEVTPEMREAAVAEANLDIPGAGMSKKYMTMIIGERELPVEYSTRGLKKIPGVREQIVAENKGLTEIDIEEPPEYSDWGRRGMLKEQRMAEEIEEMGPFKHVLKESGVEHLNMAKKNRWFQ